MKTSKLNKVRTNNDTKAIYVFLKHWKNFETTLTTESNELYAK